MTTLLVLPLASLLVECVCLAKQRVQFANATAVSQVTPAAMGAVIRALVMENAQVSIFVSAMRDGKAMTAQLWSAPRTMLE
jgi:zona occludens toxin (predicted ATPase)